MQASFFLSIFDRYRNQDTAGIGTGLGPSCIIQDSLVCAVHLLVLNHSTDLGHSGGKGEGVKAQYYSYWGMSVISQLRPTMGATTTPDDDNDV